MRQIVEICKKHNVISKVIFENCYLTNEEKEFYAILLWKLNPISLKHQLDLGQAARRWKM